MDSTTRRDLLQHVALALPLASLLAGSRSARAQAPSPVKVDTKGLVAKITKHTRGEPLAMRDSRRGRPRRNPHPQPDVLPCAT